MIAPPKTTTLTVLRESLAIREVARTIRRFPRLARQPRGEGRTVLVFPGFGAGDASTIPLRTYLRLLGYDARGWGLGMNRGDVRALVPQVLRRTARAVEHARKPVGIVGWSLGGTLAREVARERPDLVERVITLGTPVVGGPKYTAVAGVYRARGHDLDAIEAAVAKRNRIPIRVPITAVYTRSDGVVAWEACIDHTNPGVEHLEVRTTHLGLGLSPEVYEIIAQRLAMRGKARGASRRTS